MTTGVMQIDDCLLEGHLGITKELVAMQSVQKRFYIGAENGGCGLIKVCVAIVYCPPVCLLGTYFLSCISLLCCYQLFTRLEL